MANKPAPDRLAIHSGMRNRKFRQEIERRASKSVKVTDSEGRKDPNEAMYAAGQQSVYALLLSIYHEVENFND